MKTPITRQRLRNHLTYAWWKYLLLIVIATFGWNIIYTMTRYRPPEEKRVIINLYVYGDQIALNDYMAGVNETLMPDMEEMNSVYTTLDDAYGDMIISAHMAAAEGDIWLLSRDQFQSYASTGAFIALEAQPELLAMLEDAGISLTQGWRAESDTGERHLYGIPCANLPGITTYVYNPSDCYLCVLYRNGNDENVIKFLNIFMSDLLQAQETPEA